MLLEEELVHPDYISSKEYLELSISLGLRASELSRASILTECEPRKRLSYSKRKCLQLRLGAAEKNRHNLSPDGKLVEAANRLVELQKGIAGQMSSEQVLD